MLTSIREDKQRVTEIKYNANEIVCKIGVKIKPKEKAYTVRFGCVIQFKGCGGWTTIYEG